MPRLNDGSFVIIEPEAVYGYLTKEYCKALREAVEKYKDLFADEEDYKELIARAEEAEEFYKDIKEVAKKNKEPYAEEKDCQI